MIRLCLEVRTERRGATDTRLRSTGNVAETGGATEVFLEAMMASNGQKASDPFLFFLEYVI